MKVYKLGVSDDAQWIIPMKEAFWGRFVFDGTSFSRKWRSVSVYDFHAKRKRKDFSRFGPGAFVVSERVRQLATPLLKRQAEFLPLKYENQENEALYILNVLERVDALDKRRTRWQDNDQFLDITHYAFLRSRLTSASILRIPESLDVFVLDRTGNPEHEFKSLAEREQFTGVRFDEVWATA